MRVSVVGLGTVGRWLLRALAAHRERLTAEHGIELLLVGVANRRDGYAYREGGIDPGAVLALLDAGESIAALEAAEHWPTALAGLEATRPELVAEVSQSPSGDGQPGISHMRAALGNGASVATSNKWPIALAGVELAALARELGLGLRAESTVMSGTPLLAALTDGLGGATPIRLRGVLNATVNEICTRIAAGAGYEEALAAAQAAGLAEPDPGEDVDGHDAVAKLMILAALVFGIQLEPGEVSRRSIAAVGAEEIDAAAAAGRRLREVASFDPEAGHAAVDIAALDSGEPFFDVEGATNAVVAEVDPLGPIAIRGPGAGPQLAGQGVLSNLIVLAGERARAAR